MNIEKLKDIETEFLDCYPKAFEDEKLLPMVKKFNPLKFENMAKEMFDKDNFSQPDIVCENFFRIISRSALISLFDKAKLRDSMKTMGMYQKDMLSIGLYEILHGSKKSGFEILVEVLEEYKLAKWTLITLIPYYMKRDKEFFIKPTTTKNIIKYLELENLIYKPKPTYAFYKEYSKALKEVKKNVKRSLTKDNAAFTGFLRLGIEICEE